MLYWNAVLKWTFSELRGSLYSTYLLMYSQNRSPDYFHSIEGYGISFVSFLVTYRWILCGWGEQGEGWRGLTHTKNSTHKRALWRPQGQDAGGTLLPSARATDRPTQVEPMQPTSPSKFRHQGKSDNKTSRQLLIDSLSLIHCSVV